MKSLVLEENTYLTNQPNFSIARPGIWPSETSASYEISGRKRVDGKCMRAAWFRIMGYEREDRDPNMEMKGNLGKSAEKACVERWKRMGILLDNNIKFYIRKYGLSGEIDVILRNFEDPDKNPIGVEVKSFYGLGANRELCGSKRPLVPGHPKWDHLLQASVYGDFYKELLDHYRLYYLERGDGHRVEFKTLLNEDGRIGFQQISGPYWSTESSDEVYRPYTIHNVHERMEELVHRVKARDMPPKEFKKQYDDDDVEFLRSIGELSDNKYKNYKKGKPLGDWQCAYCPFADVCHARD